MAARGAGDDHSVLPSSRRRSSSETNEPAQRDGIKFDDAASDEQSSEPDTEADELAACDKRLEDQYELHTNREFWEAFDRGSSDFDMTDDRLVARISKGYLDDDEAEPEQGPDADMLRFIWYSSGKATEYRCSEHIKFRMWVNKQANGSKGAMKITQAPSLQTRERQRKEQLKIAEQRYRDEMFDAGREYFGKEYCEAADEIMELSRRSDEMSMYYDKK